MAISGHEALKSALDSLGLALGRLDLAAARQTEKFRGAQALHDAMAAMSNDRARLAGELDKALSRGNAFEEALANTSKRLDTAIDSVRVLIAGSREGQA